MAMDNNIAIDVAEGFEKMAFSLANQLEAMKKENQRLRDALDSIHDVSDHDLIADIIDDALAT